ncbi:unnamed protein product [Clonostachys rosea]|uniref:NACHT-NTPase and P-loop NTPases N-terminal domain-containing protein n=1 Tax=Bionectria ochroleuca TaxID=29856 RepID=A0ABY6UPA4_BIOOC|nr:unnamed protein product [Clonostachys rosea]
MASIIKAIQELFTPFSPEEEELSLCNELHETLVSTLKALRSITETLETAPGTSENLKMIDQSLNWLGEYCNTFSEKGTFQDEAQRQRCYETVEQLIARIQGIMSTFDTADVFELALVDATLCYNNLKYCEGVLEGLYSSLTQHPDTVESHTQREHVAHQQRRPVLVTPRERFPVLRTPPGRLPVRVSRSRGSPTSYAQRIHSDESDGV